MYTLQYKNFTIQYKLSKGNIQIVDSYKIRKKADMNAIVKAIRAAALKKGFKYKRSNSSWVTEWRAHNYMYDKGQQRSRTGSVDLNENESRWKLLSYSLMSLLYKG
jgi:hypothetical protein